MVVADNTPDPVEGKKRSALSALSKITGQLEYNSPP